MNDIDDYAPALLRIKAAVKELEKALPTKDFARGEALSNEACAAINDLGYWVAKQHFHQRMKKAA